MMMVVIVRTIILNDATDKVTKRRDIQPHGGGATGAGKLTMRLA